MTTTPGIFDLVKISEDISPFAPSTQSETDSSSTSSRESAAPKLQQADDYPTATDVNIFSDILSSSSTAKNDSDAENIHVESIVKPTTGNASTQTSDRPSKNVSSAINRHPDPRTPLPQVGFRHHKGRGLRPSNTKKVPNSAIPKKEDSFDIDFVLSPKPELIDSPTSFIKSEPEIAPPAQASKPSQRKQKRAELIGDYEEDQNWQL